MKRKVFFASLVYGFFVYLILPSQVVAVNDDFGYLRSVIATLQHGRPWTDEWLAPWNASFATLAALLFSATGNFYFATYGLLAGLAAAGFAATLSLFLARQFSFRAAVGFSTLLLTFPTFFWKEIEFTGVALYLPCLLIALWASERNRWSWFMVVWLLALASRQSAVAWAALPGLALLRAGLKFRISDLRAWLMPALVLVAGGAAFFLLSRGMNGTLSQRLLIQPMISHGVPPSAAPILGIGAVLFFVAAGLGSFVLQGRHLFFRWRHPAAIIVIALLALPLLVTDLRNWLSLEHEGFAGVIGTWHLRLLILLGAIGWMTKGITLRFAPSLWALACLTPVCLRPQIWDYYLIEVAVLGFFAVQSGPVSAPAMTNILIPRWRRVAWSTPLLICLALQLSFALSLKAMLDRARLLNETAEIALRAGTLQADELNFLPFGAIGWRLHPYFARHEGKTDLNIAGFLGYIKSGSVDVGYGFSKPLHIFPAFRRVPPVDRSRLILAREGRFCWFFKAGCYFLRGTPDKVATPALNLLNETYRREIFPLNNQEWRNLIAAQPSSSQNVSLARGRD